VYGIVKKQGERNLNEHDLVHRGVIIDLERGEVVVEPLLGI
jgi:hypothetical protein